MSRPFHTGVRIPMITAASRSLLVALLMAGCARETIRQPPVPEPSPPAATVPEPPAASPAETDAEEARRMEAAIEQPPSLAMGPDHEGIVEVRFTQGTADLAADSRATLDRLGEWLRDQGTDFYIDLQGHTDSSGSESANLKLAEHRAKAVQEYLHRVHEVSADRMGVFPLGSVAPAADNDTADGRQRNRRVVVVVIRSPD